MKLIKFTSKLNNKELANYLNVTKSMVTFYSNGKSKISKEKYEKLCLLTKTQPIFDSYIEIRNKTENINIPKINNPLLSEILGILAGDGNLSPINYEISVTCHRIDDREYILNHVSKLFKNLFCVNTKIKENIIDTSIKCVINSKLLSEFLVDNFKIPLGKKKGNLHIPRKINKNKKLLKFYLRGLFDTDGTIYFRRGNSAVVSISSRDPVYLKEVKEAFLN